MSVQRINEMLFGAEVFIEPGQNPGDIDTWFRRLKECGMQITRIRLFGNYMKDKEGNWDFSLFDRAYEAGEKYGIKIYGNLFPETGFTDVGGFKFPRDDAHIQSIADYIEHTVNHFKTFKSAFGWVPINEPGSMELPDTPFTKQKFEEWKELQWVSENMQVFNHFDFAEERFLLWYNTWYLHWLTQQILKHDPGAEIHVNNHAVFQNVAEYDFTAWRSFLTSFGGSSHASWHYNYFERRQYALAVSANCEIIRSGAGNIPWMMTELQGGNNTYSAFEPMCPTKEEITQWLWLILASGGKGSIFWCLNPRMSGFEAGEWALLDYEDEPSDRMLAAAGVIQSVKSELSFFKGAEVLESGFNILYIRESLWVEKKLNMPTFRQIEGRTGGAVIRSALSWFEALSENGIQANFKEISEFDFNKVDFSGTTIILSHQVSVPRVYENKLRTFVEKGGTLLVDGLTAYYDEHAVCTLRDFPFRDLFGAYPAEFKLVANLFDIEFDTADLKLTAHLWRGELQLSGARSLAGEGKHSLACVNNYGEGAVIWLPSPAGLGARLTGDYSPLLALIARFNDSILKKQPFRFEIAEPGMLMKVLKSGEQYLSVIINKSGIRKTVRVITNNTELKPATLFPADKQEGGGLTLEPEETAILKWQ